MRTTRVPADVPILTVACLVGFLAVCARGSDAPPPPADARPPSDYAVYAAVLREQFLRPQRGEHGLLCEPQEPGGGLTIVATTQPVAPGNARRDSGWAAVLPAPAAPLMARLRAMDSLPARALDGDSLAVGVPVRLVADSVAARSLEPPARPGSPPPSAGPPLFWLSRVAYTADGGWALVYAVETCPGVTDADAAEAESGAYERVVVAPLERRAGAWTVHPPLFLDVGLPRLGSARPPPAPVR